MKGASKKLPNNEIFVDHVAVGGAQPRRLAVASPHRPLVLTISNSSNHPIAIGF
jgi:hypothetical protein